MHQTKEKKILDHGYIKLIEHWGSDERIIEAARMSTNKGFVGWKGDGCRQCGGTCLDKENNKCNKCQNGRIEEGDEKLLRFLWTNQHTSPFEQCGMSIEVQAPIFVFREWHRHRTQSYNEMSARYTQMPDVHYLPSPDRVLGQDNKNKQGSKGQVSPEIQAEFLRRIKLEQEQIYADYQWALDNGISREIARINTPVSRYSRMVASANLLNWLKFLKLRMAENAQWEIRQYANAVTEIVGQLFPRTYSLFQEKL